MITVTLLVAVSVKYSNSTLVTFSTLVPVLLFDSALGHAFNLTSTTGHLDEDKSYRPPTPVRQTGAEAERKKTQDYINQGGSCRNCKI
ncbi:hypothetical protein EVAR_66300_1 [Eumeta japonica]|uniref:Uncharacterized protein n=1 Tax=Eumeta variegata TaxID=151549 RepID=A0A4C1ZAE1_EUMVA|nr:hypothetical protein EVAR_66300_1 [Eumeta japonica]